MVVSQSADENYTQSLMTPRDPNTCIKSVQLMQGQGWCSVPAAQNSARRHLAAQKYLITLGHCLCWGYPFRHAAPDPTLSGFHPDQFLATAPTPLSIAEQQANTLRGKSVYENPVDEEEIRYDLYRNGRNLDFDKPSVAFMMELFKNLQLGDTVRDRTSEDPVTDTIRSFSGQFSRRGRKGKRKGKRTVDFSIPTLPRHEMLRAAEIRFRKSPSRRPAARPYRLRMNVKADGKKSKPYLFRGNSQTQYDYVVFDVTEIVKPWINNHHGNMSLQIRLSKKLRNNLMFSSSNAPHSSSLIVLYLEDKEFIMDLYTAFFGGEKDKSQSSRSKRALPSFITDETISEEGTSLTYYDQHIPLSRKTREAKLGRSRNRKYRSGRKWLRARKEKRKCQIYDFHVDFEALGWGRWIIHPKKFNSKFCFGQCPIPMKMEYHPTNHAILQTLMRKKRPLVAPVPCCVPTQLKPISMLYFDRDEIVVRSHEDMIADQCGCR